VVTTPHKNRSEPLLPPTLQKTPEGTPKNTQIYRMVAHESVL
jgi:hypothetical protein